MSFRGLGLLKVGLTSTDQGKKSFEFLTLFHVLLLTKSLPSFRSRPTFFLVSLLLLIPCRSPFSCLPQVESVSRFNSRWALAFLTAYLHAQIESPYYSWGDLTLFLSLVCFLFMSEFYQEILVHAHWPTAPCSCLPA